MRPGSYKAGGYGAKRDPFWAQVAFLAHMDGPNLSTTFIDSATTPHTIAVHGAPVISTGVQLFGNKQMGLFSTGCIQVTTALSNLDFLAGEHTVEALIQPVSLGTFQTIVINNTGTGGGGYEIGVTAAGKAEALGFSAAAALVYNITGTTTLVVGTTYSVAVTRRNVGANSTFTLWVGVLGGTAASEGTPVTVLSTTLMHTGSPFTIGAQGDQTSSPAKSRLKEVRVTGACRYTISYPVQKSEFPNR